jgi:hypothetical protein
MERAEMHPVVMLIVGIVEEVAVLIEEVIAPLDPDDELPSLPDQPRKKRCFVKAPIG